MMTSKHPPAVTLLFLVVKSSSSSTSLQCFACGLKESYGKPTLQLFRNVNLHMTLGCSFRFLVTQSFDLWDACDIPAREISGTGVVA